MFNEGCEIKCEVLTCITAPTHNDTHTHTVTFFNWSWSDSNGELFPSRQVDFEGIWQVSEGV